MQNMDKINEIRKKADELKKPLAIVDFGIIEGGVVFFYYDNDELVEQPYSNADKGIEEELERIDSLLSEI